MQVIQQYKGDNPLTTKQITSKGLTTIQVVMGSILLCHAELHLRKLRLDREQKNSSFTHTFDWNIHSIQYAAKNMKVKDWKVTDRAHCSI